MRERRKGVAPGLQQRERRTAQRGEDQRALQADAAQLGQAGANQHRQEDRPGDEEACEDHVGRAEPPRMPARAEAKLSEAPNAMVAPDRMPIRRRFATRAASVVGPP